MTFPDSTSVRILLRRARRAGVTTAAAFADWLIIDVEWFGPCADMDAATYQRWHRQALAIYDSPGEVALPPRRPTGPESENPRMAVRAVLAMLCVLLVMALSGVSRAATYEPPTRHPAAPADSSRTGTPRDGP